MERIGDASAGFHSITEAIDTTTPAGRMMMQIVGAFAEFERAMIRSGPPPAWPRRAPKAAARRSRSIKPIMASSGG